MDERKKDYQMSAEFEGASDVTKIQVGRNWSKTLVGRQCHRYSSGGDSFICTHELNLRISHFFLFRCLRLMGVRFFSKSGCRRSMM